MPRAQLPDFPPNASAAEVIAAIGANLSPTMAETSARNYVIRCLAALGNRTAPSVQVGQVSGSRVRLYIWPNVSVLGTGVVLAAGHAFQPKLVDLKELVRAPEGGSYYIEAQADNSRAAERASAYTERTATRAQARAAQDVVKREQAAARSKARASRATKKRAAPARRRRPVAPPAPTPTETPTTTVDAREEARARVAAMSSEDQASMLKSLLSDFLG